VPLGHLGDRLGGREVMVALLVLVTAADVVLLLVDTFVGFLVVASVLTFFDRGAAAVRGGLIAALAGSGARATTKAYLRSITNVGMTVGTAIAAVALHADTREAYLTVLFLDAATYLASAVLMLRVPHVPPTGSAERSSMFLAMRDLPFVTMTLVNAVLSIHYWVLEIAMPLWVVEHTEAPKWLVAVLMVVNTGVVIACQVMVARRVVTPTAAVRAALLSGVLFLAGCIAFGASGSSTVTLAVVLLVLAALLQVVGELWQAAASFLLGFDLAPDHAQGQYQGLFGMGQGIASMLAPPLIAFLPLGMGVLGWWILGFVLLGAAVLLRPAVAWCERTRPRYAAVDV